MEEFNQEQENKKIEVEEVKSPNQSQNTVNNLSYENWKRQDSLGQSTQSTYHVDPPQPKKVKKQHPALKKLGYLALVVALGLGSGYVGASLNQSGKQTIIYKSSDNQVLTNNSDVGVVAQVSKKASPSVVEIQVEGTKTYYGLFGGTYTSQAAGSGVIISADGYIITNHHVVDGFDKISVTTSEGKSLPATLVGSDEKSDIAIIKVNESGLTPAVIGDSDKLNVGDLAVVIGNPLGTLGGTVTDGIISATNRDITINNQSMNLIQTNAAINSGNSGGGLFNGNGDLVGIVNMKDSGTTSSGAIIEGLGFAIPINDAMNIAEQLIKSGKVTDRATLGVYIQQVDNSNGNSNAGLYIADIIKGSGAEKANLQKGDRIVAINDVFVEQYSELAKQLANYKVGDKVTLTIVRDGKQQNVEVTLSEPISEN